MNGNTPAGLSPPWLTTDDPRRARRAFADGVALAPLSAGEQVVAARLFDDRWGRVELVRALQAARRRAALAPALDRALRELVVCGHSPTLADVAEAV